MRNPNDSDLKRRVEEHALGLSRIQKKLASYLIHHWNDISLMSIEQISKDADVSTATITRFSRLFNFKGFYDFKNAIKQEVSGQLNPVERFRLLKEDLKGKKSLMRVARQDVKNINKLLATVDENLFQEFVQALDNAQRIFSFGASISSILSSLIRYTFNQISREAHCLDEGSMTVEEKILTLSPRDLILFCSFHPYSRNTIDFARLASEQGLRVLAISDNAHSPISEHTRQVLAIPRENILFTTSLSAFTVLINAMATEIAYRNKEQLTAAITRNDKILKPFYYLT